MTTDSKELITYESQILTAAQSVGLDLTPLLAQVPEADEDAYVGIIRQLLGAQSAADLQAPFSITGMQDYLDKAITVWAIKRMPSDFDSGLGLYLVCDISEAGKEQRKSVSTGSTNIIVQLVKAHVAGWLPLHCIPREAKKPTAQGYTPMHLEVIA